MTVQCNETLQFVITMHGATATRIINKLSNVRPGSVFTAAGLFTYAADSEFIINECSRQVTPPGVTTMHFQEVKRPSPAVQVVYQYRRINDVDYGWHDVGFESYESIKKHMAENYEVRRLQFAP
jgi:hypothetical protein